MRLQVGIIGMAALCALLSAGPALAAPPPSESAPPATSPSSPTVVAPPPSPSGIPQPATAVSNVAPPEQADVDQPVFPSFKLGAVNISYSIGDATDLNGVYYSNQLIQGLRATWNIGALYLHKSPFSGLAFTASESLTYTFAGFDPSSVIAENGHGPATPCSDLPTTSNGSVIVNNSTVKRCNYSNTYRAEPSDLRLSLSAPSVYTIPVLDIDISPAIAGVIPISYQSRYSTLITWLNATVGFEKSFLHNTLTIGYSFGATKYFHQYTTPEVQTVSPDLSGPISGGYSANDVASNNASFYAAGANASPYFSGSNNVPPYGFNADWGISDSFSIEYIAHRQFRLSASYSLSSTFSYPGSCGDVTLYGNVTTNPCANADAVARSGYTNTAYANATRGPWRQGTAGRDISDSQLFILEADYVPAGWVSIDLRWITASPLRTMTNGVYNPFWGVDANAFTTLSLGATFSLQPMLYREND